MVAAKSAQKDSHAVRHAHSNGNGKATAAEITKAIKMRQVKPEPLPETVGHVSIIKVQPKTNETPKTVRTGTSQRHMQRGKFSLMLTTPYAPSIFFNQVIEHISDGKLAHEVGEKMYPQIVIAVFKTLDQDSFSLVPQAMYEARKHVFELINDNHDAIYGNLWLATAPSVEMFTDAIHKRRRILRLFKSDSELELLEEKITIATKVPGWLAIEASEPVLKRVNGHGGLTFEKVLKIEVPVKEQTMTLFSLLQRKSMDFLEQRKRVLENERYLRMPMSTERVAGRVKTEPNKYPLPQFAKEHEYKLAANSVGFKDSKGEIFYRSRIALFVPALEVVELQDGNVAALVGSSLVGLSNEEMEYLRPKYKAEMQTVDERKEKSDWVEDKRDRQRAEEIFWAGGARPRV